MKRRSKSVPNITKSRCGAVGKKTGNFRIKSLPLIKNRGRCFFYLCHNFLIKGDEKKTLCFPKGRDNVKSQQQDVQHCANFIAKASLVNGSFRMLTLLLLRVMGTIIRK